MCRCEYIRRIKRCLGEDPLGQRVSTLYILRDVAQLSFGARLCQFKLLLANLEWPFFCKSFLTQGLDNFITLCHYDRFKKTVYFCFICCFLLQTRLSIFSHVQEQLVFLFLWITVYICCPLKNSLFASILIVWVKKPSFLIKFAYMYFSILYIANFVFCM